MTTPYEEGLPRAAVCILGEAPSHVEMRQGRPLVGPSGQLLENCLHSNGIVRRECYLTNVFPYQVKKLDAGKKIVNEFGDILWTEKQGLSPLGQEEAKDCFERLRSSEANVIVPLGNTALQVLFGDARITKWRGSILESTALPGRKIIPTIHPAAVLRGNFLWKHLIASDLGKVKEQRGFPELRLPQRRLIITPSFKEVLDYLDSILELEVTAFDIELVNHHIYCICFSRSPLDVLVVPFVDAFGSPWWSEEEELTIWTKIAEIMAHPELKKLAMNAIFDVSVLLMKNKILTAQPIEDIMIAHHIIWPDFPKGLDFMTSMHTDEPYYKDEGKQYNKVEDPEKFRTYNAKDGAVTHEVWNKIQPALADGYEQTYLETMELFHPFLFMMLRGIKVDRERLEETKARIEGEIARIKEALDAEADYPINPLSPKQCQEYFYGHKGIKPYVSRSTGRPTTDDKAMSRIYRRYKLKEAKLIQEYRAYEKLRGTYLEVGIDKDGRVRCSYNLRGTVSGRPSSSQTIFGTGMNLQNLHPQFKEFLVAD